MTLLASFFLPSAHLINMYHLTPSELTLYNTASEIKWASLPQISSLQHKVLQLATRNMEWYIVIDYGTNYTCVYHWIVALVPGLPVPMRILITYA